MLFLVFSTPQRMPQPRRTFFPRNVWLGLPSGGGVERVVKQALARVTTPRRCPEQLLFVPEPVHPAVLRWGHSSKFAVHPSIRGTLAVIRQRFWWPTRERDIRCFVTSCPVCAQTKSVSSAPAGLLRLLLTPSRPWSHIALDFVKISSSLILGEHSYTNSG